MIQTGDKFLGINEDDEIVEYAVLGAGYRGVLYSIKKTTHWGNGGSCFTYIHIVKDKLESYFKDCIKTVKI